MDGWIYAVQGNLSQEANRLWIDAWKSAWFCYWIQIDTKSIVVLSTFLFWDYDLTYTKADILVTNKIMRWQFSLCQVRNYFLMVRVFFFFLCCLGNNTAFGNRTVCPGFLLSKVAVDLICFQTLLAPWAFELPWECRSGHRPLEGRWCPYLGSQPVQLTFEVGEISQNCSTFLLNVTYFI